MELLPIFLNVREKTCVIIGGGDIAFRKAVILARAGAKLKIVSSKICSELQSLCSESNFEIVLEDFSEDSLSDATLVVAATNDSSVNEAVSQAAMSNNIPVNVVDQPQLCSFIVPSIVDRTPVVIAISSSGSSPVLLRKIKELNETLVPGNIGEFARFLQSYRSEVKRKISNFESRIEFWENVIDSDVAELVYANNIEEAKTNFEHQLKHSGKLTRKGEVYLVGAGPGDPDLLTLKALRLMHKADVVLYDRLVSKSILSKVRADAEKIYVGKQRSDHSVEQEGINEMLVRLALSGKRVMRLKGGDPFIFGRGGEELESLAQHDIPFQVVPGITAASGCASYAGIPLTHREHSQSVRFLTGHLKKGELELDWKSLVNDQETLVFYMGLFALEKICENLIDYGMEPETAIAVVEQGTTEKQRVVSADLLTISQEVAKGDFKSPSLIIIGSVVSLRNQLAWR